MIHSGRLILRVCKYRCVRRLGGMLNTVYCNITRLNGDGSHCSVSSTLVMSRDDFWFFRQKHATTSFCSCKLFSSLQRDAFKAYFRDCVTFLLCNPIRFLIWAAVQYRFLHSTTTSSDIRFKPKLCYQNKTEVKLVMFTLDQWMQWFQDTWNFRRQVQFVYWPEVHVAQFKIDK